MNKCRDRKLLGVEAEVLGIFVPRSDSSRERKFRILSLPGAKVLKSESSIIRFGQWGAARTAHSWIRHCLEDNAFPDKV